jgi:protein CpxP
MKKLQYVLLAAALMAPASMLAQNSASAEGQPEAHMGRHHIPDVDTQLQRLSKKLKLTDEQKPQVKTILEDQRDQMQKLMQDSSGSRAENRQKMREIHENASSKIRSLLTDEQKAKYDKLEAKRRERMEKHMGHHGGAPDQGGQQQ